MSALQRLIEKDLDAKRQRYPSVPPNYIKPTRFEDKTANTPPLHLQAVRIGSGYTFPINKTGRRPRTDPPNSLTMIAKDTASDPKKVILFSLQKKLALHDVLFPEVIEQIKGKDQEFIQNQYRQADKKGIYLYANGVKVCWSANLERSAGPDGQYTHPPRVRQPTGAVTLELTGDGQQRRALRTQLTRDPHTLILHESLDDEGFVWVVQTDSTEDGDFGRAVEVVETYLRQHYDLTGVTIKRPENAGQTYGLPYDPQVYGNPDAWPLPLNQPSTADGPFVLSDPPTQPAGVEQADTERLKQSADETPPQLTVEELTKHIEQAAYTQQPPIAESCPPTVAPSQPPPTPTASANGSDPSPPTPTAAVIPEITAADLLTRKVESIPCLVEPILQAVGLAAVAGSSDVGKSAFLRQLAFAVATNQSTFLGWTIRSKHRSAIYVSTEDDENATAFLLYSLNKQSARPPAECARLRFVFETHDLLNELDRRLTSAPADLVVIDAFGDLYPGDANKTNQIRQFLHEYSQLAQKHGCLILWLHHTGKRTDEDAPSKHHVIGGQGFEGKMRLLIELRRDHQDPTRRHLCIVKGNYLPDDHKTESYVLTFENFMFGQTGQRVAFDQLAKPQEQKDAGQEKYDQIQQARQQGYKGESLARHLNMTKGYISQIEKKYGLKADTDQEFTESLAD